MGTAVALLTARVWVLCGGDGVVSTGTGLLSAGVHTTLLFHHCIYSYQLISNLKDAIETPMAQQVCFKPVSLTCLLL